jgi:hypothetical protein
MSMEQPVIRDKIEMTPKMMESSFDNLNGLTAEMAQEINRGLGVRMINPEGQIKMSMWGGENIKNDQEQIYEMKKKWCGLYIPDVREYREKQYGTTDEKSMVEKYSTDRKKTKPALMESAITILFHKILQDRFLVVKSSEWDDYVNGADNIIIDKETGQIVGMFDEIDEKVTGQVKDRGIKKDKQVKIIEEAMGGGSEIKYGLTFEPNGAGEKKIVKKSFANIPIFYLSLELEDLGDLINSLGNKLNDKIGAKGLEFFDKFIASLEGQADLLQDRLSSLTAEAKIKKVSDNIGNFKNSLAAMKELRGRLN